MRAARGKQCVNTSLISLKIVVFFVITGITALHLLHAIVPQLLGLNFEQYRNISIIAPFVSILGPLIAGPLADRFAAKNSNNFGRVLRFLTALFLVLAAIVYAFLFAVEEVKFEEERRPLVRFGCNENGAIIYQERCSKEAQCHNFPHRSGSLNLTNCTYTCQDPNKFEALYKPWLEYVPTPPPSTEHSAEFDYGDDSDAAVTESMRKKPAAPAENGGGEVLSAEEHAGGAKTKNVTSNKVYVKPPHVCLIEKDDNGMTVVKKCHAYTNDTTNVVVHSTLRAATNSENDTYSERWCKYLLDGFQCNLPLPQVEFMTDLKNGSSCKPMVQCLVPDPYDIRGSALAHSQCLLRVGNLDTTLTAYYIIRILGDIFTLAALTLLNTAIIIAVRETSEGRGEVCRQYVFGAIGYILLFSLVDLLFMDEITNDRKTEHTAAFVALILVIVSFVLGALLLLIASGMPLSPAEWWWHTKTGVMVYPMSAIRRYSPEIFVLTLVAILFGTFWSSIHSYLKWTFTDQYGVTQAGLLLVLLLFFNVDKFIEYCGHSNIFIAGFAIFIIRFTALSAEATKWLTVLMEVIEPLVIGVIWITIMLYMRHAMPRKLTATGQALAVLAFFGIGKGCGALIGLARDEFTHNEEREAELPYLETQALHQWLAIAAGIIAVVYFIIYNLILAPRCTAKPQHFDDLLSGSASQTFAGGASGGGGGAGGAGGAAGPGTASANNGAGAALNGNGNYSPLRVYHNERGKKGQFRF